MRSFGLGACLCDRFYIFIGPLRVGGGQAGGFFRVPVLLRFGQRRGEMLLPLVASFVVFGANLSDRFCALLRPLRFGRGPPFCLRGFPG